MSRAIVFDEVVQALPGDLCWFVIYEALVNTAEFFDMEVERAMERDKFPVFSYTANRFLASMLEEHVFFEPVQLSEEAMEKALQYFAMHIPHAPTYHLGTFLNYAESWCQAHADWREGLPADFHALEFNIGR